MLAQRLIVAIILIPVGISVAYAGGWVLAISLAVVLSIAAWEYWRLFRQGGYHPSVFVLTIGTAAITLARHTFQFQYSDLLLTLILLITMAIQVFQYERGKEATASTDFSLTLGGILYLGWLGAYLISVRDLPDGRWWLITVVAAVLLTDGAAYFVGSRFGRHKMSPVVSPKKTWEGYIGGIIFSAFFSMLLAMLWHLRAPAITYDKGLVIGLVISVLSPLGDLGESMLKRSFGVKDTSHILPGHGGIMDRIDSWLWAAPLGYYLIVLLWM